MTSSIWSRTTLDQVVTLQRGHDLPSPRRRPGTVPVVGSFGITGWHDLPKAKGPGVAIGRSGASIGVATYVEHDYWPLNTALYVTDFHGNDERWVYWLLDQIDFSGFNSGSAQPSLNRNYLARIPVLRPPVEEQRAIVRVLNSFGDLIGADQRLSADLRAHSAALYKRSQADPSHEAQFGDIAELVKERADPAADLPYLGLEHFAEDGEGLIGEGHLRDTTSPQQRFWAGDVLYGKLRPYFRKVARPGFEGACSAEIWVLRPKDGIPPSFLNAVVAAPGFTEFAMAGSEGTKMPRAKWDHVREFPVGVPSGADLKSIALVAEAEWEAMVALQDEVRDLKRTRAEIVPRLMEGRIRISDQARGSRD